MKEWTEDNLVSEGYEINNARITSVDLSMADHGVLTLEMGLNGAGWGCVYGGYVIGTGYLGSKKFEGSAAGMESIIRIMDVVGVDKFNDMKGKYVRVATKGWGNRVKIIGNILMNKWFDIEDFFKSKKIKTD